MGPMGAPWARADTPSRLGHIRGERLLDEHRARAHHKQSPRLLADVERFPNAYALATSRESFASHETGCRNELRALSEIYPQQRSKLWARVLPVRSKAFGPHPKS